MTTSSEHGVPAVSLKKLNKSFGDVTAVSDLAQPGGGRQRGRNGRHRAVANSGVRVSEALKNREREVAAKE